MCTACLPGGRACSQVQLLNAAQLVSAPQERCKEDLAASLQRYCEMAACWFFLLLNRTAGMFA